MPKHLVYINGLRGPEAQIWDEKAKTRDGKPVVTLLQRELTPAENDLTLDELKQLYPIPIEAKP